MGVNQSLKLTSTIQPIWCTVPLGTLTCCQMKVFIPLKRNGLLQHTVDNQVSALVRFSFYRYVNMLIGIEKVSTVRINCGVGIKRVEFREKKEQCIFMRCQYGAGFAVLVFACTINYLSLQ